MRVWGAIGMVGAAMALVVVATCLLLARGAHRPEAMHWVSCLGSRHAPRHVRILFRVGVGVAAALFGAFAVASLVHAVGWRPRLGAGASVLTATFLALVAICPMDGQHPRLHVLGAVGYFVAAIAAAFLIAFPPADAMDAAILAGLAAGGVVIVPMFGIVAVRTFGMSPEEITRFFIEERKHNVWVRVLEHPGVGITGVLLFFSAFAAFRAVY